MPRCEDCARILHTGEARVLVAFTVAELEGLTIATDNREVRQRLLRAIDLLDPDSAEALSEAFR